MENESVIRLTNTILLYAVRDGAREIRLHAGVLGVQVLCSDEGKWREEAPLPLSLWDDVKARIALMSENWDTPIRLAMQGTSFLCAARLEREFPHETIVLMFDQNASVSTSQTRLP